MFDVKIRRSLAVVPAILAVAVLAACSAPSADDRAKDDAANDAAATRFVTCLTGEGQTAKIVDGGQVGVLMPDAPGEGELGTLSGGGSVSLDGGDGEDMPMTMIFSDDEGTWLASTSAAGYPEEGGQRAAWEKCEEEVPEFEQPEPDISGEGAETKMISSEEIIEAGLAVAACARENGFTDFADPDADGMLELPVGITEDEARTLLEACADAVGDMPPMFTPKSVESADFDWFALIGEYFEGAFSAATVLPSGGDE